MFQIGTIEKQNDWEITLVKVSFAALPISPKWGGETIALSAILRVELKCQ